MLALCLKSFTFHSHWNKSHISVCDTQTLSPTCLSVQLTSCFLSGPQVPECALLSKTPLQTFFLRKNKQGSIITNETLTKQ